MIPLFNTQEIRDLDSYAITKLGIPGIVLMENAAINISKIISDYCNEKSFSKVAIICGKGNNGGDGFAVARHLAENGFSLLVMSLGNENEMTPDCKTNFLILKNLSKINNQIELFQLKDQKQFYKELEKCNLIIDAILGSGASGQLKEPISTIIKKLNKFEIPKIAIDIPTGLDCDKGWGENVLTCDLTITLALYKKGLFFNSGYLNAGTVELADIGIDKSLFENLETNAFEIEPEDALEGIPQKAKNLHKYSSGKTLSICGSGKYPGAGALVAKAALKIGAGASILAFPKSCRSLVYKDIAEVVVEQYNDNGKEYLSVPALDSINKKIVWADAVAIGSGLGREPETVKAVHKILEEKIYKKLVIDADAVFALNSGIYKKFILKDVVFTPHLKEFSDLIG
ncbi:MAG: NAD(P)H-hydrate epimerase, partial [Bacteroidota bacterium]|nr:NAD(P)H-hydrate epimerase [Bacteroidota bacterium]